MIVDAEESFREYVRARLDRLSKVAYLLTGDRHLAEDLVQVTLVKVAQRWERITAGGDPDPYVRRVLYTSHVAWWRRDRLRAISVAQVPDRPGRDVIADVSTAVAVRRALALVTPRQRAVLVLRYFEDLTETQTAAVLGCSVGTVKSHAHHGLARLREAAAGLADVMTGADDG